MSALPNLVLLWTINTEKHVSRGSPGQLFGIGTLKLKNENQAGHNHSYSIIKLDRKRSFS